MITVLITLADGSSFKAQAGSIFGAEIYYCSKFFNGRSGLSQVISIQEVV